MTVVPSSVCAVLRALQGNAPLGPAALAAAMCTMFAFAASVVALQLRAFALLSLPSSGAVNCTELHESILTRASSIAIRYIEDAAAG